MAANTEVLTWLRKTVAKYELDLVAVFRKQGTSAEWPLTAASPDELEQKLAQGGHFVPLPKEPAALANVLEVSLVDFLLEEVKDLPPLPTQSLTDEEEQRRQNLGNNGPRDVSGHVMTHCVPNERVAVADEPDLAEV